MDSFKEHIEQAIDAKRLPWLVDKYLSAMKGKIARKTGMYYRNKLRWFLRWAEQYEEIRVDDMADFRDFLAATNMIKRTQADLVGRVGQMFKWAVAAGVAQMDYSLWLPTVKAAKPTFIVASIEDVQRLINAAGLRRQAHRDQAFIALLAGSGLRLAEATALNTDDVVFDNDGTGKIYVRSGKGSKSRTVVFSRRWSHYVRKWKNMLGENQHMFTGHSAGRGQIGQNSLYREFKAVATLANMDINCHDMRRHFATQWMKDHPGRLTELQRQLGHSDPGTTSHYIWSTADDIHEMVRDEQPFNNTEEN